MLSARSIKRPGDASKSKSALRREINQLKYRLQLLRESLRNHDPSMVEDTHDDIDESEIDNFDFKMFDAPSHSIPIKADVRSIDWAVRLFSLRFFIFFCFFFIDLTEPLFSHLETQQMRSI